MNSIKINIQKSDIFVDLIIRYQCMDMDIINEIKCHRIILSNLGFFNGMFRNTKLDHIIENNMIYYVMNIKLPFNEKTFLSIINGLYDGLDELDQLDDGLNICDIIEGLYYLNADDKLIHKYYDKFMDNLIDEKDYDKQKTMFIEFCNLQSIDITLKQAFIARFEYILNDLDRDNIKNEYNNIYPKKCFQNTFDNNYIISNNNHIILSSDFSWPKCIDYNGWRFKIYRTQLVEFFNESSYGFWIECESDITKRIIKTKIILNIYDGYDIYNFVIRNKRDENYSSVITLSGSKQNKYGIITYDDLATVIAYEFDIEILE